MKKIMLLLLLCASICFGQSINLTSVTYGDNQFVAVGESADPLGSVFVYSPNNGGYKSMGIEGYITSIVYGNGQFVAIGWTNSGVLVLTSSDGSTWATRNLGISAASPNSITYGNGQFVAVGGTLGGNCVILTSPDALTWAENILNITNNLYFVTYEDSLYVAASYYPLVILTSSDGMAWSIRYSDTTDDCASIIYAKNQFMAFGSSNTIISSDGITWTKASSGITSDTSISSVAYGNGQFMAVGWYTPYHSTKTEGAVWTSSDGITWTRKGAGFPALYSVAYGNGMFMIVGSAYFAYFQTAENLIREAKSEEYCGDEFTCSNPIRGIATLQLPRVSSDANVSIYNLQGRRVFSEAVRPGQSTVTWNTATCRTGKYLVMLPANGKVYRKDVEVIR